MHHIQLNWYQFEYILFDSLSELNLVRIND